MKQPYTPGKFGVAYAAAEDKAAGLGFSIKRTKIFAVLEVSKDGQVWCRGNLTKVFQFLDQKAGEAAVASYNAAQRAAK